MSKDNRNLPGRGLLVAACFGLASGVVVGADGPPPQGNAPAVAARSDGERYLLLKNGRLIRGVVSEDEAAYTVTQRIGAIRYPKTQVERPVATVEEAYRYQLERIPDDDPAEQLRLARWCMSLHLDKEAKTLLEQVVEISPSHAQAKAMLMHMNQAEAARLAGAETKVDEDVRKTSAAEIADDRPGALDSAVLRGAERRMGITGLPVIFDLPPAMAVRRAEQFKQYVHPVLQACCAKCHNAEYPGTFQLVAVRTARQRTPDALRANLDATLRLIDRENPAKSELLTTVLLPHGNGGKGRPIFLGSNDRAYQILSAWVTSLKPQTSAGESPTSLSPRSTGEAGESFAADRSRSGGETIDEIARSQRPVDPRPFSAMGNPGAQAGGRAYRYVEGQGMLPEDARQADPREFPLPYMLGGSRPQVPGEIAKGDGRIPPPATRAAGVRGTGSPRGARPDRVAPPAEADDSDPALPEPPKSRAAGTTNTPAAKKKPVTIDPKILEKLLQKNANRPVGQ